MATIDSASFKSIQTVDLHHLSQLKLHALSLCSDGALTSRFCDDVVIPKIDRSVFNESAGSRKQTYSRLRLAPASSVTIHRRTPHLRTSRPPPETFENDPERAENSRSIHLLKEFSVMKRKRGRPRKDRGLLLAPMPPLKVQGAVPDLLLAINSIAFLYDGRHL